MRLRADRFIRRSITIIAAAGMAVAIHGADDATTANGQTLNNPAQQDRDKEIQDLKRQVTEEHQQIEELRLLLLNQKKQIDGVAAAQSATPVVETPAKSNVGDVA